MFCSRCGTEVDVKARFCPSCGLDLATTTPAVAAERTDANEIDVVRDALKDEYEIVKELGRGGMAIVFHAREKHLDRDVAIKVLPFSLSFDKEFVERFQREARTSAKLEHPNIIPIYRVGKSGRAIYFVMKFLRGGSLSEMLEQRGSLPPEDIRRLLAQTAGALGYAHRNGIVHRDIKPDNIMFDEMGHAVVTDFGIAKAATGTRLTGTGMSIGTPHYMSPEQARAQPLDGRSDLYSLGVVAYQCLLGRVPFDGEDAFAIGYKHIMEELATPDLKTPAQRDLFGVIRRMMAKSPADRFQTAEELVSVLDARGSAAVQSPAGERTVSDLPTTIMPSPAYGTRGVGPRLPATPTTPIPKTEPSARPKVKEKRRSGALVGFLLVMLLGGGGATGYWYFGMGAPWPLTDALTRGSTQSAPPESTTTAALGPTIPPATSPGDSGATDSLGAEPAPAGDTAAAPLSLTGTIILSDRPSLSRVTIDGVEAKEDTLEMSPGSKKIRVEKTGFRPFEITVSLARGGTVVLPIPRLEPLAPRDPPRPVRDPCSQGADYDASQCYDVAPTQSAACLLERPPDASGPLSLIIWVRLRADGSVESVQRQAPSGNPSFDIAAQRFASQLTYAAGSKGGRPVAGWTRVICRSR